jgi:hypothetical protein
MPDWGIAPKELGENSAVGQSRHRTSGGKAAKNQQSILSLSWQLSALLLKFFHESDQRLDTIERKGVIDRRADAPNERCPFNPSMPWAVASEVNFFSNSSLGRRKVTFIIERES